MRFTAIALATLSLVYGAPLYRRAIPNQSGSEQSMEGFQGAMTNYRQTVDTLNRQLKAGDPHAVSDTLVAYITGADSQIDNAIATVGATLSPLTFGLSQAVANVILGPFVQAVTNGAEVLVSRLIGNGADLVNDAVIGQLTGDYTRLAKLSSQYNIDSSKLQSLNEKLQSSLPKEKRAIPDQSSSDSSMSGVEGSVTNSRQVIDTLRKQMQRNDGHMAADAISAFITGADSQIDNAIATVGAALSPLTFGVSQAIADQILGPFAQAVTNGVEVLISNVIGGGIDLVTDGGAKMLVQNLARLHSTAQKFGINAEVVDHLASAQSKLAKLVAQK